jgi:hypothetical protein
MAKQYPEYNIDDNENAVKWLIGDIVRNRRRKNSVKERYEHPGMSAAKPGRPRKHLALNRGIPKEA